MAQEITVAREGNVNPINAVRNNAQESHQDDGWVEQYVSRVKKKFGEGVDINDPNEEDANFRLLTPSQRVLGGGMSLSIEQFYDEKGNSTYHTAVLQSYKNNDGTRTSVLYEKTHKDAVSAVRDAHRLSKKLKDPKRKGIRFGAKSDPRGKLVADIRGVGKASDELERRRRLVNNLNG